MCDWLHDGSQRLEANGHVQQVGSKEEVVEVAEHGKYEVPNYVEEGLKRKNEMFHLGP